MTDPLPPSFEALGLRPELLRAVTAAGYQQPTPVQRAAIPAVLQGRDVRARAHTGSGKTAAFGLPLLQRLLEQPRSRTARGNQVAVLVLAPTRELVVQTAQAFSGFARLLGTYLKVQAVFGGVSKNPQMLGLRGGADVLVATPGRLLDLQRCNAIQLEQLHALVLDEADRMLSPGFREELEQVLACLPARRQTLLFSATFPDALDELTTQLLRDPLIVDVTQRAQTVAAAGIIASAAGEAGGASDATGDAGEAADAGEAGDATAEAVADAAADIDAAPAASSPPIAADSAGQVGTTPVVIEQHVYEVDLERKPALLIHLLQQRVLREARGQALVFVNMKKTADKLTGKLERAQIRSTSFHGDKSQHARTQALADFRSGKVRVLIATDLAARGLDLPQLPAVINYELPRSPNDYAHRIGRTGRAGHPGLALSLICETEAPHFRVIEKRIKQRLPRERLPTFEPRQR